MIKYKIEITEDFLVNKLNCVNIDGVLCLEYRNNHYTGRFEFHFRDWFRKRKLVSVVFYNSTLYWDLCRTSNELEQHKYKTAIMLDYKYFEQLNNLHFALTGRVIQINQ